MSDEKRAIWDNLTAPQRKLLKRIAWRETIKEFEIISIDGIREDTRKALVRRGLLTGDQVRLRLTELGRAVVWGRIGYERDNTSGDT